MDFKEYVKMEKPPISESAQAQLDAMAKITALLGKADISTLKRVLKTLESGEVNEAKMSNDEVKSACEKLAKNGDDKAKAYANGMLDYFDKNGSFHPNQVSGLQNIMKNASFQLAEK